MTITEGYNALYLKQHGIRQDFHEGLEVFPNALETSACTANVNALGRNVMEAQGTGREDDDSARRGDNDGPDLDKLFPPANASRSD